MVLMTSTCPCRQTGDVEPMLAHVGPASKTVDRRLVKGTPLQSELSSNHTKLCI